MTKSPQPSLRVEPALDLRDDEWRTLSTKLRPELRFFANGWLTAWSNHLSSQGSWKGPMRLLVARGPSEDIQGVLPLATQRLSGLSATSLAGPYLPFRMFLVADDPSVGAAVIDAFADHLTRVEQRPLLRFGPIPAYVPETQQLIRALGQRGWSTRTKETLAEYWQTLPPDYDTFRSQFGKRRFKKIRYYRKKLEQLAPAKIVKYDTSTTVQWSDLFPDLTKIEQQSWVGQHGGDDRFIQQERIAFWREFANWRSADHRLSIWVLFSGERPISYNLVFDCGDTRYALANAYDQSFSDFRTGSILLAEDFADAFDNRIRFVNWGPGDSGYKSSWGADQTKELVDIVAFRPSVAGRTLAVAFGARRRAQSLAGSLRSAAHRISARVLGRRDRSAG